MVFNQGPAVKPECKIAQNDSFDACQVIDHIPDIFLLVNNKGIIVRANNALESILGWKPKEVIGSEIEIFLSPEMRGKHQVQRKQLYEKPATRDMNELVNLSALHKKGYLVPIDIKLSFMEISGETYGVAIVRDATKQRELQKSIEDKYKIIKQTLAEKNHLLGIAAHDMRNPVGIIQIYSQILLADSIGQLNEEQHEFVKRIYQSSFGYAS